MAKGRKLLLVLTAPEVLYLRRFFDGVDTAVSKESSTESRSYEEFLTPVLGRLLDGDSPFQNVLPYSIRHLNEDLALCGSGNHVSIRFHTHEHSKGFSGSTSHVDLGIVLRIEGDVPFDKAILVESKRLYPVKGSYRLNCRYEGFRKDQHEALERLSARLGSKDIFYFLYNPQLAAFETASAARIRMIENSLRHIGPYIYRYSNGASFSYGDVLPDPDALRDVLNEYSSRAPGLRVASLEFMSKLVETKRGSPALADFYDSPPVYRDFWSRDSRYIMYCPFSEFMVGSFLACNMGTTEPEFLLIARGGDPALSEGDESSPRVLVSHTLEIRVGSHVKRDL